MNKYLRPEARPADWNSLDQVQKDAFSSVAEMISEAIDGLMAKRRDVNQLGERIEGIDADAAAFGQRVRRIRGYLDLDANRLPIEQIVLQAAKRLDETKEAQTRRQALSQERLREEKRRQDAAREIEAMNSALSVLCREAGGVSPEERRKN